MSIVAITCPSCGRSRCINGRAKCRCGVYLVHHATKKIYLPADLPCYLWDEKKEVWSLMVREA